MPQTGTNGFDDKGMKTSFRFDAWNLDVYIADDYLPVRVEELHEVKKNYPADLIRLVGTQWVFLSREFSEYVIASMYLTLKPLNPLTSMTGPWARKLFVTHSSSDCADESMFQLIANNSPFANNTFSKLP